MINPIIQAHFFEIQPSMNGKEEKRQRIYDLLEAETK